MEQQRTKQLNLTEGPILATLTRLAAPIMATAFLSTAYTLTDAFWVGQLGAQAVAGVGTGGMYLWLAGGLIQLARTGGQVYTAQSIGAGDPNRAARFAGAAVRLALLIGIIYGLICFFFAGPLISFFKLNDPLSSSYAVSYLRITGGLIVFSFAVQVLTGLFTAEADSKTPFVCNVIGLAINMILDPLLILGPAFFPRLEAVGAAVATVIAQAAVLTAMVISVLGKKKETGVLRHLLRVNGNKKHYADILRLSVPSAIQTMSYCAFSMILARLIAPFGDAAIAVQRIGGQIESVSWNVSDGFAAALNAFTAQNYGAGKKHRYVRGYYLSSGVLFLWGSLIAMLFLVFPTGISSLFFHEADTIAISVGYLMIISICEPFMCIEIITVSALSALEKTKLSSIISITLTASRIPLALALCAAGLGVVSFWWALTLTSVAKGITFFITYSVINRPLQIHAVKKDA